MRPYSPLSFDPILIQIAKNIQTHNGRMIAVGGMIRDHIMGLPVKDYDFEILGFKDVATLIQCLKPFGTPNCVGKAFGVVKLRIKDIEYDFALGRTEEKSGKGHGDFSVDTCSNLTFKEAAKRRDFTINAIGQDVLTNELLDPYNGLEDIKNKRLHPVSEKFIEDPLRVFRAMQFAARLEFTLSEQTIAYCRTIPLRDTLEGPLLLPKERIFEEFKKMLLKSRQPSLGFQAMDTLGLTQLFPELEALKGCLQDPEWHPEGDVWTHTMMVVDEMAQLRTGDDAQDSILMLAALCHDFGKPATTTYEKGRWRSLGHEAAGVAPTTTFLKRLTEEAKLYEAILPLVKEHLKPALLYKDHLKQKVSDGAIRRLTLRVNIAQLLLLAKADHFGRTTPDALRREFPHGEWLESRIQALNIMHTHPQPLLLGRHLIALGMTPGPKMGALLHQAFELQLDDVYTTVDALLQWAKDQLK